MEPDTKADQRNIPGWMLAKNDRPAAARRKSGTGFLTKTLREFSRVFQNEIFCERFVTRKGYLQMVDPRVKLLTLLFFMLYCAMTKSMISLVLLAFISFTFALLSELPMLNYFKRVWLFLPPVIFVLSIPAATNLFAQGIPLFYIYRPAAGHAGFMAFPQGLYVSYAGAASILMMSFRAGSSLSFAYLLIMTTRWSSITKAFSLFRLPALVVTILNMAYRYIFLISRIAVEMMEARFLRTTGIARSVENRNFMANRMSCLFIKTSYLSDEIYDAMRCRGFTGKTVSLYPLKIKSIDIVWIASAAAIGCVLGIGEFLH